MFLHVTDPDNSKAVISAQRAELQMLQAINPTKPIRIKILEGKTPKDGDTDLYRWLPFTNVWYKVNQPIYTRGILLNEILIDPDTTDWQAMKAGVEKICSYCKENNIPVQKGFSGGKGVHCSIVIGNIHFDPEFFNKIKEADIDFFKTIRRALFFAIMERAGVKPEDIKVDMPKISFNFESKGSQVRTFGTTRAPGLYKTLIEKIPDNKPKPYELPLIFPKKINMWEIKPGSKFYQIVIDALEKEVERAKKANEYQLTDIDFAGSEIMEFPCVKALYEAKLVNGRYYAGEAVLLMSKKCEFSKEEAEKHMRELYRTFPTISPEETDRYIDNALSMYETKNFSCRALKELFPDLKLCDFSACPLNEKIKEQIKEQAKKQQGKQKEQKEAKRVTVHFDEVGDRILDSTTLFTMRDTGEIYLYSNGFYENEGAKAILDTKIRLTQKIIFREKWKEANPDPDTKYPEHTPKATTHFVKETLAYFQSKTHISRESIEAENARHLNFQNCLFNLDTWETEEYNPGIRSISQIPIEYDPEARCPKIAKFLNDVAKPEDIPFLLEWAGYCLTSWVMHQKSLMVYGIPGTGKSVFLALLEALVGERNCSAESLQKLEEDKYRCANLYGKRVNICSDIPSTKIHKTDMFKRLTSGIDTIDAEKKYMPSFNFKNTAKLTFSANKLPEGPKDPAFYERFCLIEFPKKFRGTKTDDKRLIGKLTESGELSGFLNLALEGLKILKDSDCFSYSKTFEETEKEYLLNSNPVAYFMENFTVVSPDDIDSTVLYGSFINWCTSNNLPKMLKNIFGRTLSKLGYTSHRDYKLKNDPTFYENVAIKKDELEQATVKKPQNNHTIEKSIVRLPIDSEKSMLPQDTFPFVENYSENKKRLLTENTMVTVGDKQFQEAKLPQNEEEEKIIPNNRELLCGKLRFFDSGVVAHEKFSNFELLCGNPELSCLMQGKFPDLEPEQSIEYLTKLNFLKNEIKTFHSTWLRKNGGIDDMSTFYEAFIKANPGFRQNFSEDVIIFEIEKVCKKIPSDSTNVSDQEDSGEVESTVEG